MSSAHEVEHLGNVDDDDDERETSWPCPECFGFGAVQDNLHGFVFCWECGGTGIDRPDPDC